MKQTLFVRLEPDRAQFDALLETMRRFNEACNHIASAAYRLRTANKMKLQKHVYREIRERFGLSAYIRTFKRIIQHALSALSSDLSTQPLPKLSS
jgi:predicted transposase